ncbi:retron system putative HNH endonuclease [Limnofasciculus baicalensis]|uniref:TIGR02646 family protein n=1 Tax=Limnofasciculus baicalensis BBK-W-15 TaxID=2699891 RepID=A0AAE3GZX2_9CYAN|nr:retron system putative HNH endonuclease [Limnofasciculus baicalensis]MCP2731692.1 TIGR02646 family protein [Limnofasciculus baicalensis BBK-W-15]
MKHIVKGKEPQSLLEHRLKSHTNYDNYQQKDDLRESLLTEQGYICCYCMGRIAKDKMKIEHWQPQSSYPDLQLAYQNLLGACKGNERKPKNLQHCDTNKGESKITINPTDAKCEKLIKYGSNGQISSDDETINQELNEVLNLNTETLTKNRKAVVDAVIKGLEQKYPDKTWTVEILTKEIAKYTKLNQDSQYQPYCQVAISYLHKKLLRVKNQSKG